MKNQLVTRESIEGKFMIELWRYETTPSGNVRIILMISSEPVFDSADEAIKHLTDRLNPAILENTEGY